MNNYKISYLRQGKKIALESLPLAKITHYPLEKRDYKPYAQVSLGFDEDGLHCRLASFQVDPDSESKIGFVLYPYMDNGECALVLWGTPKEVTVYTLGEDGEEEHLSVSKVYTRNGGDLQGKYWGYDVFISKEKLESSYILFSKEEKTIAGNFFKVQEQGCKHYGCYKGADFSKGICYNRSNMIEFPIISF